MEALGSVLPIVALAALFWFVLIRPQRRRQAATVAMQSEVAPGDEVMIASGIFGTVAAVDEDRIQLEVSPGVQISVAKGAIAHVVPPAEDETADTETTAEQQGEGA